MWFLRRMMRISWTEKKSNEEVLLTAGTSRELTTTIRKRQMKFLGHSIKKNGIERVGRINGKRDRRRHGLTYLESLNKRTTNTSMGNNEFLQMSNNRKNGES